MAMSLDIEQFIARWTASSGTERAKFQSYANELCRILGIAEPHPAVEDTFNRPCAHAGAQGKPPHLGFAAQNPEISSVICT
jgi:hypothetical protein